MKNSSTPFNVYEHRLDSVRTCLDRAVRGEYVIPSIQRPFVWMPHQVARLVDSLLHGWPCGSLLLWEPGAGVQNVFPVRPFVTRMLSEDAAACERRASEKPGLLAMDEEVAEEEAQGGVASGYRALCLDGQQRLSSLVLAFHEASGGYVCLDAEWKRDLNLSGGRRETPVCKRLCFNLRLWRQEMEEQSCSYHYLDADEPEQACLVWKTQAELADDRERYGLPCGELVPLNEVLLRDEGGRSCLVCPPAFAAARDWLIRKVEALMDMPMSALVVNGLGGGGDIAEAVVTMFTRLNTSGTPLTKEQILSARIKKAWRPFPQKLAALQEELAAPPCKMELEDDELVRGFNIVAMAHTQTTELTLAYERLKEQGAWLAVWSSFREKTLAVTDALYDRYMRKQQEFRSMYIVWYAVALLHLQHVRTQQAVEVDEQLGNLLVKWACVSSWSRVWANSNGPWVKRLNQELVQAPLQPEVGWVKRKLLFWIALQAPKAADFIRGLQASARGSVREYYSPLWVWMRLDESRSHLLSVQGASPEQWEVDHIVPAKWAENCPEMKHTINSLGNCWLLERHKNIRKRDKSFPAFFADMKSRHMLEGVELEALSAMLHCEDKHLQRENAQDLPALRAAIEAREVAMKEELLRYMEDEDAQLVFISPYDLFSVDMRDVYRGREYARDVASLAAKDDYVKGVRRVMKVFGISAEFVRQLAEEKTPQQQLAFRQKVAAAIAQASQGGDRARYINPTYETGWNRYMALLFDPKPQGGRAPRRGSRRSGGNEGYYLLDEFLDFCEESKLAEGDTPRQARKYRNNHGSYVRGYYDEPRFREITEENIRSLCERRDARGLQSLISAYRHSSSGYPAGWSRYIGFLIKTCCQNA